jgi:hypothetical protein
MYISASGKSEFYVPNLRNANWSDHTTVTGEHFRFVVRVLLIVRLLFRVQIFTFCFAFLCSLGARDSI